MANLLIRGKAGKSTVPNFINNEVYRRHRFLEIHAFTWAK